VEEDGSAHFVMPAGKAVYFQVLDERGFSIQSMMSAAYTHAGERLMCQGCHEPRHNTPSAPKTYPLALRRAPSRLVLDVEGTWPMSFARLVQPVLDAKCVACHQEELNRNSTTKAINLSSTVVKDLNHPKNSPPETRLFWTEGYKNLIKFGWSAGGASSTPGEVGTVKSSLFKIFGKGHHDVKLTPEEWHRFSVWLDCGSPFFGAYEQLEEQAQGKLVLPAVE
jgi:cytochrome c553